MASRSLGHRAPLLWIAVPLIAGLAAGHAGEFIPVPWELAGALVAGVMTVAASWLAPRLWAPSIAIGMFLAGSASYELHRARLPAWDSLPPREARLALRIDRIFPQADPKKIVGLGVATRVGGPLHQLAGQRFYFSLTRRKEELPLIRGAVVSAIGVVTTLPRNPPADTFDGYLANAGINFRLNRGRVLTIERSPSRYNVFLDHAAEKLNAWLSAGVAAKRPELAAVFRAMMLGQKHELSDEQKALFMHSGTMHLFAINGLHIGVVAVSLHALLAVLRCPRPIAAIVTLAVLWLDVDTTGASPSAVRAFLLVVCYEVATIARRPGNGIAALSAAALIVLLMEPMALFSASFQMSYGVVLAILTFGLPLAERIAERWPPFKDIPQITWTWRQRTIARFVRWIGPVVGIGIAAAVVSAITGPTFFQVLAPGGFFANIVLVPLAMLVIVAGFAAVVSGVIGLSLLGVLFNHAAMVLLVVIDALIRLGVNAPGTWWAAQWRAEWIAPAALATLLGAMVAGYATGWRSERGGFWPPFAIVALVLVFGVKLI